LPSPFPPISRYGRGGLERIPQRPLRTFCRVSSGDSYAFPRQVDLVRLDGFLVNDDGVSF
jgi:hypothetical protein